MELCSGGRMHQPLRDRGGERPAHGEAAPSLGVDAQVPSQDSLFDSIILRMQIISAPRILAAAFQLWFHPVSVHLFLYICPMIAVYLRLSISPRISPSISVQTLCSTHKLCICPMNCKLFLNVVMCEFYNSFILLCRSTISAFVLLGEAQANP